MASHHGHVGLDILNKGNVWCEDTIWESSAHRLPLKLWDWMRSCRGNETAGTKCGARQHTEAGGRRASRGGEGEEPGWEEENKVCGTASKPGEKHLTKRRMDSIGCCGNVE